MIKSVLNGIASFAPKMHSRDQGNVGAGFIITMGCITIVMAFALVFIGVATRTMPDIEKALIATVLAWGLPGLLLVMYNSIGIILWYASRIVDSDDLEAFESRVRMKLFGTKTSRETRDELLVEKQMDGAAIIQLTLITIALVWYFYPPLLFLTVPVIILETLVVISRQIYKYHKLFNRHINDKDAHK